MSKDNREEIIKICESFGDRARGITKYINYRHKEIDTLKAQLSETEEKLKRAYQFIIDRGLDWNLSGKPSCNECNYMKIDKLHEDNCIVLEAQTWLEDKE